MAGSSNSKGGLVDDEGLVVSVVVGDDHKTNGD